MKTSNKLLITFALALILIPLLGMVYVSQVNYKNGKYGEDEVKKVENFTTPTKNMASIAASTAFDAVTIENARNKGIYIHFIKDEKFGLKIPEKLKDSIDINVNANGQLQINFRNKQDNSNYEYQTILVYAPNMRQLNITNASSLFLDAVLDSLSLTVKNSNSINLQNDLKISHLNVNTDNVKSFYIRKIDVKSLVLTLKNTKFNSAQNSFDNLSINASDESEITLNGDNNENNSYAIRNLNLNTLNKADVKVEGIKIDHCSGSFSNETTVQMPAVNLNQMYKK
ncbi:MAG: hypothetical protein V4541_06785 [Bacteroidota bacterium]